MAVYFMEEWKQNFDKDGLPSRTTECVKYESKTISIMDGSRRGAGGPPTPPPPPGKSQVAIDFL